MKEGMPPVLHHQVLSTGCLTEHLEFADIRPVSCLSLRLITSTSMRNHPLEPVYRAA